jgi:putative oxidoreductase
MNLFAKLAASNAPAAVVIMVVAILSTKIPILLESGFWKMAHAARTDFAMTLGSLFLLIVGAGAWSGDAWLARRSVEAMPRAGN